MHASHGNLCFHVCFCEVYGVALGPLEGLFWRFGGSWQGSWRLGSMLDDFRAPRHPQMQPCWVQVGAFLGSSW